MTALVVALPQLAQRVLTADVPDLEVHVGEGDGADILADCGHGALGGRWRVGEVNGFNGTEECGFAGVVEAEEEDGIFWEERLVQTIGRARQRQVPSLLVA